MNNEQVPDSSSLTHQEISHRAVSGVAMLTIRKAGLQGLSYGVSIILARILAPEIFGIFAIVNFIITFFAFFSDVGLGAALIQKKKELSKKDLASAFTFQQILVFSIVILIFILSPFLASKYSLNGEGMWLIRALSLSLVLTSLKTIPAILLERQLKFGKLIIPEVIEVVSFQMLVLGMALMGYEVWSFVIALLVRGTLGVIAFYVISPWKPSFHWDKETVASLIKFGIPYQMNGFLAMIKDAVFPIFVGMVSGAAAVGYLNWANTFSKLPIIFMSDVFRVTFPTYSRLQDHKDLLQKAIERTLRFTNLFLYPAVFILAGSAREIVTIVFTDKWLPALPAFYIHLLGILVVGIANVFMDTFWALGKTRLAATLLAVSTVINWGVSIPLVYYMGFTGAMVGAVIVLWVSLPLNTYFVKKIVPVRILPQIWSSFLAAAGAGIVTYYLSSHYASNIISLLAIMITGGIVYIALLLIIEGKRFIIDIVWVLKKIGIKIPDVGILKLGNSL